MANVPQDGPPGPLEPRALGLAEEAYHRAWEHLATADILAKKRRYPAAYAFLVLAMEEEAKYNFRKFEAIGLFTTDKRRAADRFLYSEEDLLRHSMKQGQFTSSFFWLALGAAEKLRLPNGKIKKTRLTAEEKGARKLIQRVDSVWGDFPNPYDLEARKQAAFYSDTNWESGDPVPRATGRQFRKLRPLIARQLAMHAGSVRESLPLSTIDHFRSQIKQMRVNASKPPHFREVSDVFSSPLRFHAGKRKKSSRR